MLGIILKDFLFEKQNLKTFLLFMIVFVSISFMNEKSGETLAFILPFITIMTCITTFNYDEYNHWDGYMASFPIRRTDVVKSKYIFTSIMIVISTVVILMLYAVLSMISHGISMDHMIEQFVGGIFGISIFISMLYPLIYKYGIEKGRIGIFILAFGIGMIGYAITKLFEVFHLSISWLKPVLIFINTYYLWLVPILSILFLFLSYLCSAHFYKKKEF